MPKNPATGGATPAKRVRVTSKTSNGDCDDPMTDSESAQPPAAAEANVKIEAAEDSDEVIAIDDDDDEEEEADVVAGDEAAATEASINEDDDEEADAEEVIDEVGEVDETNVQQFEDADAAPVVSLETSNAMDNEDSLNLTIGEDEEQIFQDEVRRGERDEPYRLLTCVFCARYLLIGNRS